MDHMIGSAVASLGFMTLTAWSSGKKMINFNKPECTGHLKNPRDCRADNCAMRCGKE